MPKGKRKVPEAEVVDLTLDSEEEQQAGKLHSAGRTRGSNRGGGGGGGGGSKATESKAKKEVSWLVNLQLGLNDSPWLLLTLLVQPLQVEKRVDAGGSIVRFASQPNQQIQE